MSRVAASSCAASAARSGAAERSGQSGAGQPLAITSELSTAVPLCRSGFSGKLSRLVQQADADLACL
jgi:hypothetical protein